MVENRKSVCRASWHPSIDRCQVKLFFLMPVCLFWGLQDTEIQLLCSYFYKLHSRSYTRPKSMTRHGLIIYIAHMSPTLVLVCKKISELFKKPKKWNAHLVGIIGKGLLSDGNDWYVFWKRKYLVKTESVKTLFCNLNQFNLC